MQDGSHAAVMEAHWGGGVSPFAATWQKTMMWIFIVTDGLLFSGLLCGYGYLRMIASAGAATGVMTWPKQSEVFSIPFIALMTFILITSSATMGTAVGASRIGDRKMTLLGLAGTIAGGLAFLGCQAFEWTHLIHEGARLTTNPWGPPQFAASFFVLTGFHGSHVFSGVVILVITAVRATLGKTKPQGVELTGLYWHFVDLVWVFIFTLFYLL